MSVGPSCGVLPRDRDQTRLLASAEVEPFLRTAVTRDGGTLLSWRLDQIDAAPHRRTTATYVAVVARDGRRHRELLGVSVAAGGQRDARVRSDADDEPEVTVWCHPDDPALPGLARAARPGPVAALLTEHRLLPAPVTPEQVRLERIGYRPRRRAVLRATVRQRGTGRRFYVKVLQAHQSAATRQRHELLAGAGVPVPPVLAATGDHLLVLGELPGTPLARAVFAPDPPLRPERLLELLDGLPAAVAGLERRRPWADAVEQYAEMITVTAPTLGDRLSLLAERVAAGLRDLPAGTEATHGDFHEGQLLVDRGRVTGLLDVDTLGPGRRVDDLACLLAHLSTVQRMDPQQADRLQRVLREWAPVLASPVDPDELRLRTAAVVVSLATGPYRGQEPDWLGETSRMVATAEWYVRAAGGR